MSELNEYMARRWGEHDPYTANPDVHLFDPKTGKPVWAFEFDIWQSVVRDYADWKQVPEDFVWARVANRFAMNGDYWVPSVYEFRTAVQNRICEIDAQRRLHIQNLESEIQTPSL
jgi:hypothetical protein